MRIQMLEGEWENWVNFKEVQTLVRAGDKFVSFAKNDDLSEVYWSPVDIVKKYHKL